MLKRLRLKNFTVFADADLQFAPGLTVVVGENGTGKSHVLKLAYSLLAVSAGSTRREREYRPAVPTVGYLQTAIADKLRGVFRPDALGRLATRKPRGLARCEVGALFRPGTASMEFSFSTRSTDGVQIERLPTVWLDTPPVFIPTRELLTLAAKLVPLFETTDLPFEETWRDTSVLLSAPAVRGRRLQEVKELLDPLEDVLGGSVEQDKAGDFYVAMKSGNMEAALVSEGQRKLAMLVRLLATGSLGREGCLLWDEPEANLNAVVVRRIARTILQLVAAGVQVVIATHSLFLMRELDILHKSQGSGFGGVSVRFIGLPPAGGKGTVLQSDSITEIGPISSLDEELHQSERYLSSEVG